MRGSKYVESEEIRSQGWGSLVLNISPCKNIIFKKVFSSLLESGNFGPHSKKVGPLGVLEGFWQSFLNKECVGHTVASPFTLKTILRRGTLWRQIVLGSTPVVCRWNSCLSSANELDCYFADWNARWAFTLCKREGLYQIRRRLLSELVALFFKIIFSACSSIVLLTFFFFSSFETQYNWPERTKPLGTPKSSSPTKSSCFFICRCRLAIQCTRAYWSKEFFILLSIGTRCSVF
jgi:hypothetical protein